MPARALVVISYGKDPNGSDLTTVESDALRSR